MSIEGTDLFAAMAHRTRLRSLMLMQHRGELCVCELSHAIGVAQPHLSRHLALLREQALVADRRVGTWVFYRLHPALPVWATRVLAEAARGLATQPPFADDARALDAMVDRPGVARCA
jgi:ArsR family transcriptional regulator